MSDSVGDYTEYVELLCTDLFRFDFDASGIRPAASGVVSGLLPEKSAIAPFGSGYVCLSEVSGSYINMYVGKGRSRSGRGTDRQRALYARRRSYRHGKKLSELPNGDGILWAGFTPETVLLSGENGSCTADLRSRHDHRRARRRCDPGGCAASVEKRRLCRLPA